MSHEARPALQLLGDLRIMRHMPVYRVLFHSGAETDVEADNFHHDHGFIHFERGTEIVATCSSVQSVLTLPAEEERPAILIADVKFGRWPTVTIIDDERVFSSVVDGGTSDLVEAVVAAVDEGRVGRVLIEKTGFAFAAFHLLQERLADSPVSVEGFRTVPFPPMRPGWKKIAESVAAGVGPDAEWRTEGVACKNPYAPADTTDFVIEVFPAAVTKHDGASWALIGVLATSWRWSVRHADRTESFLVSGIRGALLTEDAARAEAERQLDLWIEKESRRKSYTVTKKVAA